MRTCRAARFCFRAVERAVPRRARRHHAALGWRSRAAARAHASVAAWRNATACERVMAGGSNSTSRERVNSGAAECSL